MDMLSAGNLVDKTADLLVECSVGTTGFLSVGYSADSTVVMMVANWVVMMAERWVVVYQIPLQLA